MRVSSPRRKESRAYSGRMELPCKHAGTKDCGKACECTCDTCQEYFEKLWEKYTKNCDLCRDCGMPHNMTLEALDKYRDWHFFQPCEVCKPAYVALMCENRLCVTCQTPLLPYGTCTGCDCTGELERCECRHCVAKRRSEAGRLPSSANLRPPQGWA